MGDVPLSCSGTPEGTWCGRRGFPFFFPPSFFLSLRFGLLRIFFRAGGAGGGGAGGSDFGGPWTEAVVGHATWFSSDDTLREDGGNSGNDSYYICHRV